MNNPAPTSNKAVRIGPDSQPVFPCWLWHSGNHLMAPQWTHSSKLIQSLAVSPYTTHWHPDQPTAPTFAPEEDNNSDSTESNNEGLSGDASAQGTAVLSVQSPAPDWAMEAAKEIIPCGWCDNEGDTVEEREHVAAIIRKRAPSVPAGKSGYAWENWEDRGAATVSSTGTVPAVEGVRPGDLMPAVIAAIESFPHAVPFHFDLAANICRALTPYLAPVQRVSPHESSDQATAETVLKVALSMGDHEPGVTAPHPTAKQADPMDTELLDFAETVYVHNKAFDDGQWGVVIHGHPTIFAPTLRKALFAALRSSNQTDKTL